VSRAKQAAALLDAAWDPDHLCYDTQGVNQAHRVLLGGDPPRATRCTWGQNDEGAWDTSCGRAFEFTAGDPVANGFAHCPYCGLGLREVFP